MPFCLKMFWSQCDGNKHTSNWEPGVNKFFRSKEREFGPSLFKRSGLLFRAIVTPDIIASSHSWSISCLRKWQTTELQPWCEPLLLNRLGVCSARINSSLDSSRLSSLQLKINFNHKISENVWWMINITE